MGLTFLLLAGNKAAGKNPGCSSELIGGGKSVAIRFGGKWHRPTQKAARKLKFLFGALCNVRFLDKIKKNLCLASFRRYLEMTLNTFSTLEFDGHLPHKNRSALSHGLYQGKNVTAEVHSD